MELIRGFSNVYMDSNSTYTFEELNEREFIASTLSTCCEYLKHRIDDYVFFIFSSHTNSTPASAITTTSKGKILIYISDEADHSVEHLQDCFLVIFKSYLRKPTGSNSSNVLPFPLGYVNGFKADHSKHILAREYNLFFSGNLNSNRFKFYKYFTLLSFLPDNVFLRLMSGESRRKVMLKVLGTDFTSRAAKRYVRFNNTFKSGLSIDEYSSILAESKIVLCPRGFISSQTFRLTEALSCGCIVISEILPDNHFYRNSPIIQVRTWREGIEIAKSLLNKPDELNKLHNKSIDWWRMYLSDCSVAKFITDVIEHYATQDRSKVNILL